MINESILKSSGKIPKWVLILGGIFVLIIIIVMAGGGEKETPKVAPLEGEAPAVEEEATVKKEAKERVITLRVGMFYLS